MFTNFVIFSTLILLKNNKDLNLEKFSLSFLNKLMLIH